MVFNTGIFDVDDVILNGFGVMIGYWAFLVLRKWISIDKDLAKENFN